MYKPVQSNLFVLNCADFYVTGALLPIIIIILGSIQFWSSLLWSHTLTAFHYS